MTERWPEWATEVQRREVRNRHPQHRDCLCLLDDGVTAVVFSNAVQALAYLAKRCTAPNQFGVRPRYWIGSWCDIASRTPKPSSQLTLQFVEKV